MIDAAWKFLLGLIISVVPVSGVTPDDMNPSSNKPHTNNSETVEFQQSDSETPIKYYSSEGKYSGYGQNISYTIKIPQEGGNIEGSFSGTCSGSITGIINQDKTLSGDAEGKCPFGLPIKGTFKGKLDSYNKEVNLNYEGSLGPAKHGGDATLSLN